MKKKCNKLAKNMKKIYKRLKIGDELVTPKWDVTILARSMKEAELKALWEIYQGNRLRNGFGKPATKLQIEIAAYAKKTKYRISVVAEKFKIKSHIAYTALKKVALQEYLNS